MYAYLLFCLVLAKTIESSVIKEYPLTLDGLEIDFEVKNKDTELWRMQIEVNEQDKTVRLTRSQPEPPAAVATEKAKPVIENRFSLGGTGCPTGYVKRGSFCFPEDD